MKWFPTVWSRADETTYTLQGYELSRGTSLRELADAHVRDVWRHDRPSPLRVGWLIMLGLARPRTPLRVAYLSTLGHLACVALAWAMVGPWSGLLVASSPLGLGLSRRALGDTWAAATVLGCLAWPSPPMFALALLVKESSVVPLVVLALFRGSYGALCWGGLSWGVVLFGVFGWTTVGLFRVASRQADTDYSRAEQRGMPHRVLVDLVALSPAACVLGVSLDAIPGWVVATLACAALMPLKNVRLLLSAELVLRISLAAAVPWWGVLLLVCVDMIVFRRTRDVYDPTSRNLIGAVC